MISFFPQFKFTGRDVTSGKAKRDPRETLPLWAPNPWHDLLAALCGRARQTFPSPLRRLDLSHFEGEHSPRIK